MIQQEVNSIDSWNTRCPHEVTALVSFPDYFLLRQLWVHQKTFTLYASKQLPTWYVHGGRYKVCFYSITVPIAVISQPQASLASHTLRRERKGLVTLQPLSCHKLDVTNQICALRRLHPLSWSTITSQRIQQMSAFYYLTAMADNCIPQQQLGSCNVTRPFLSLRRVWLARLALGQECSVTLLCVSLPTVQFWQVLEMLSHSGLYGLGRGTNSRGEVQLRLLPLGKPAWSLMPYLAPDLKCLIISHNQYDLTKYLYYVSKSLTMLMWAKTGIEGWYSLLKSKLVCDDFTGVSAQPCDC